jgi:hypothetical protein
MEPDKDSPHPQVPATQTAREPLGPSPAVREVLYRAIALVIVIIAGVILIVWAAVSLGAVLVPALTSSPPAGPAPAVTAPVPATIALPSETAPVEFMPEGREVTVTVGPKDSVGKVLVRFDGGPGRALVKTIDARLTRPDGSVVTGSMDPQSNTAEFTLEGSRGTDQVEVFATMYSGKVYKIYDQSVPYLTRS